MINTKIHIKKSMFMSINTSIKYSGSSWISCIIISETVSINGWGSYWQANVFVFFLSKILLFQEWIKQAYKEGTSYRETNKKQYCLQCLFHQVSIYKFWHCLGVAHTNYIRNTICDWIWKNDKTCIVHTSDFEYLDIYKYHSEWYTELKLSMQLEE